ncbi:MAG: hypothetical protein IH991_02495 [Planctomycetes bacterium]|nr:hypothetical protein [Planctomycetota bacterium]
MDLDEDDPELIRLDRAIYRHMAIRGTNPGTVSSYHYLKSVPTNDMQDTLDQGLEN